MRSYGIYNLAQLVYFLITQVRIVADIEAVEVDMLGFGKEEVMVFKNDLFQVRLADLIAAARASTTKLDSGLTHGLHEPLDQDVVRAPQYEIERVITGPINLEIGAVLVGIQLSQKPQ
jgi:hypothetical protein